MPTRLGRYRLLHPIGQGKMSVVYLARDPVLSRLVAVKVIHADLLLNQEVLQRFFQEAKVAARTRSPHIVSVYDLGQEGRSPYLVMEFIHGLSLRTIMESGEPLPPIVAASLMCQVAEGLSIAAEAGVVHRDLKPGNLMISEKGHVSITDFGTCHLRDHTITRTGQVLGSPRFMAPEQVFGLKPVTPQSDLFSLGAVLYYCLSGKPPFQAESLPDLFRQITEEPHTPLEAYGLELDPFLIRLVDTLLEKDMGKRGKGARWLQFQLKRYLHHQRVIDPAERVAAFLRELSAQGFQTTYALSPATLKGLEGSFDLGKRPIRFPWRRKAFSVRTLLVLLGLGIGAGYYFYPSNKKDASSPVQKVAKGVPMISALPPTPALIPRPEPIQELPHEVPITAAFSKQLEPIPPVIERDSSPLDDSDIVKSGDETFLTIQSVPPYAEVFLDGYSLGRTPLDLGGCPSGKHRLVLKSEYGADLDTLVTLLPGRQTLKFTLLQNPQTRSQP